MMSLRTLAFPVGKDSTHLPAVPGAPSHSTSWCSWSHALHWRCSGRRYHCTHPNSCMHSNRVLQSVRYIKEDWTRSWRCLSFSFRCFRIQIWFWWSS